VIPQPPPETEQEEHSKLLWWFAFVLGVVVVSMFVVPDPSDVPVSDGLGRYRSAYSYSSGNVVISGTLDVDGDTTLGSVSLESTCTASDFGAIYLVPNDH